MNCTLIRISSIDICTALIRSLHNQQSSLLYYSIAILNAIVQKLSQWHHFQPHYPPFILTIHILLSYLSTNNWVLCCWIPPSLLSLFFRTISWYHSYYMFYQVICWKFWKRLFFLCHFKVCKIFWRTNFVCEWWHSEVLWWT